MSGELGAGRPEGVADDERAATEWARGNVAWVDPSSTWSDVADGRTLIPLMMLPTNENPTVNIISWTCSDRSKLSFSVDVSSSTDFCSHVSTHTWPSWKSAILPTSIHSSWRSPDSERAHAVKPINKVITVRTLLLQLKRSGTCSRVGTGSFGR